MADYAAPPPGPPPPPVPPGWLAKWDANYNTFFYVNVATKQSQWEPPTVSATPPPPVPPRPDSQGYPPSPSPQLQYPPPQQQYPPPQQQQDRGLGSKISSFLKGTPQQPQQQQYYPPQPQQQQQYYAPQQAYYGAPPPQQQGYYAPPPQQQQYYAQPPQAQAPPKKGIGMGTVALGAGAGLLGGMLLEHEIDKHEEEEYMEGYQDAQAEDYGDGDGDGDW
ncbi:hypothetical protein FN846DRAFT_887916 [Sphaerosporella brunnea]|uniref:WW domain-containing protein n=1 Tax=Sphaerosporella brunnea TaxID=1250544 RepID=A0A5J5F4F9_9PEZI|nr:hypothetical protein FN846DRAFT_887916 [Sphaerosporella brunnea]